MISFKNGLFLNLIYFRYHLILKSTLKNLLILEDNLYIGKEIVSAAKELKRFQEVYVTKSLKEAISFFSNINFKFVVLDLNLPDGNGIELLKYCVENQKETKVFIFSSSIELKRICLKYGAFAFFDKANGLDELIEALKNE
ncbi:response regulator [Polaribacter glomeratus]|nr:response regulator [Polaribacter glomeratus]